MIKSNHICQVLGYAGLLPFLIGTYFTWCGPMQEIIYAAELFAVYSVAVLCFTAGNRWANSFALANGSQIKPLTVGGVYVLVIASVWLGGHLPATLIVLSVGYIGLWLHEFFVPVSEGQASYRIMRTVFALTAFVCHLLVAMQIYTL